MVIFYIIIYKIRIKKIKNIFLKPSYWSSKKNDMVGDLELKNNKIEKFGFENDPNLDVAISIQHISKVLN
jgi:hypothetical protein